MRNLPCKLKSMCRAILSNFIYKTSETTACVFEKKDLIKGLKIIKNFKIIKKNISKYYFLTITRIK